MDAQLQVVKNKTFDKAIYRLTDDSIVDVRGIHEIHNKGRD